MKKKKGGEDKANKYLADREIHTKEKLTGMA
jgi:hypothetical protein